MSPVFRIALVTFSTLAVTAISSFAQSTVRPPRGLEFGVQTETAQRGQAARPRPNRLWRLPDRRGFSQEPAIARGYADGYRRGLDDGRDRDRYDPVGSGDYRSGAPGYYRDYGSRDSYRVNYRAGFRQGYEDGYRDAARGRR